MTAFMVFYGEGVGEEMKFNVIFPQQIYHEKTRNLNVDSHKTTFSRQWHKPAYLPRPKRREYFFLLLALLPLLKEMQDLFSHRIINGTQLFSARAVVVGITSIFIMPQSFSIITIIPMINNARHNTIHKQQSQREIVMRHNTNNITINSTNGTAL
jgi:hypothetical protein